MIVYGIPNCDTVKKATAWLNKNNIPFQFHDYKKQGITKKKLKEWCKHFGWQNVLNKNSTTFKELSPDQQQLITDEATAINLMFEKTSCIKRPITEVDGKYLMRFKEEEWSEQLVQKR